jgi:hypothetical protein
MQVIVNREELVEPLAKQILSRSFKQKPVQYKELDTYVSKYQTQLLKSGLLNIDFKEVNNLIYKELESYTNSVIVDYKKQYRPLVNWLSDNFENLKISPRQLLKWYSEPTHTGFIKNIAKHLSTNVECVVRQTELPDCPVLIRNTIRNEESIRARLLDDKEFWFTDAGYTNFVAVKGKPWHRLVHNHVHTNLTHLDFPADRLKLLDKFPLPWRPEGKKILVVESSDYHHRIFDTTHDTWRSKVTNELAEHTDRPIEYRAKENNRKTRNSVYELLMSSDDYYCIISDSSAAAVEAVWAGVPVITLNTHITSPIARTQISDIDNLYRGPIGDWLCALSYSQFTKKEMQNGTAWKIIQKYHA